MVTEKQVNLVREGSLMFDSKNKPETYISVYTLSKYIYIKEKQRTVLPIDWKTELLKPD